MSKATSAGIAALALALMSAPAIAQSMDHAGHGVHQTDPVGHDMADVSEAEAVLLAYRNALVERDAGAMKKLFAQDSAIFENGKDEGTFSHYMEHHLGPELAGITSFTFSKPTVTVLRMGHMAMGRETYTYRIELADGRLIEREGAATSVLMHDDDGWQIVQYHSSSRAPRAQ